MKIVKRIALVLGILLVIYIGVGLFAKSTVHVERSTFIAAEAGLVYDQINNLKNWKNWSYWDNIDPNMVSGYEGPEVGIGAMHKWESENDSVGHGSLTITQSEPGKFVETKLEFEGMGTHMGGWKIQDTTGGVQVTTYMDMNAPFYMRPVMLFMDMDAVLGADFEKALKGLKERSESLVKPAGPEMKIETTMMPAMNIIVIKDSCSDKEISERMNMIYEELRTEMTKQGASFAGSRFGIFHRVDFLQDSSMFFVLEAGIPVDKPMKNAGRAVYREEKGGNVVKAAYYGPYDGMTIAHMKINEYMKANGITSAGAPWEVYVMDSEKEPDPSRWLTEICYPVN
ncbi:MAG TPA: GyrI-like domain-containing protein [Bacteroidia bacterium]|nr:GyrI-like domain-containing protein [Bacteroidia bacterium]